MVKDHWVEGLVSLLEFKHNAFNGLGWKGIIVK